MRRLKKLLKISLWAVLVILVVANLYLIISGKTYVYTAIAKTYLQGDKGPTIYDQDKFAQNVLAKSDHEFKWIKHPLIDHATLTEKQLERLKRNESTSLLIIKNDSILYEQYWDDHTIETVSNSFSMAKSIVSLLIGCAIEDGKIQSLDDPVSQYITEFKGKDIGAVTLRNLLSMSSGIDWVESGKNPLSHNAEAYFGSDLNELVLSLEMETTPGEYFNYKSGNTQVLAMALVNAIEMPLSTYAQDKIWSKIGTEKKAIWNLDKEGGVEKAYCCFYSTTRDYAKLGKLMNQQGSWSGQKIIPSSYVKEITTPADLLEDDNTNNDRYGLHWWLYPGERNPVFYARGIQGQYIICIPDEDIVIVRTGHRREPLYKVPENKEVPKFMEELTGHPQDLRLYIKLAFLVDSQIKYASKNKKH